MRYGSGRCGYRILVFPRGGGATSSARRRDVQDPILDGGGCGCRCGCGGYEWNELYNGLKKILEEKETYEGMKGKGKK